MAQILIKGETVYKCDECMRRIRVLTAREGIDVVNRCTITYGCKGRLHKVKSVEEANSTPAFPEEVPGVQDWFQRRVEYTHHQPIKSKSWIIKHNLANKPTVYCYVAKQTLASTTYATNPAAGSMWYKSTSEIDDSNPLSPTAAGLYRFNGTRWVRPSDVIPVGIQGNNVYEFQQAMKPTIVETIDANTIKVTFDTPQYGTAQCISSASQNTANPIKVAASTTAGAFQLSNKGEITIATLNPSPFITVAVNFKSSTVAGGINVSFSNVDNTASVNSSWVGVSRIFLNGKTYTVRSFDIAHLPPVPAIMTSGNVDPLMARFTFENFSSNINENLILLGNAPHYTVDRIYDRYVDIANLNRFSPEIYYNDGEIYISRNRIKTAYPLITTIDYADVSTVVEDTRDTVAASAAPYWINTIGTGAREYNYQVAVDVYNNVYTIGYSMAGSASFVAKYDTNGSLMRQWQLNNTSGSFKQDITTDSLGNIYTAGFMLDPSSNQYQALVVKYNSSGTVTWQRAISNISATRGCGIVIDNSGNVVVSGYTSNNTTGWDMLLAKFSNTGDIMWQSTIGGAGDDISYSVATDTGGNIVVVGHTTGSGTSLFDIVVAKINPAGSMLWQKSFDAAAKSAYGYDICCDSSNNIYIAGTVNDNITAIKMSSAGAVLWAKELDGVAQDGGTGIAVDPQGNVYISGYTSSAGAGGSDGIIVKLSSTGTLTWIRAFGSTVGSLTADSFGQIVVDGRGNMFVTGNTVNTFEGNGMNDALLIKLPTDGSRNGIYSTYIYQPVLMTLMDSYLTQNTGSMTYSPSSMMVTPATLIQSDSYLTTKHIPIS